MDEIHISDADTQDDIDDRKYDSDVQDSKYEYAPDLSQQTTHHPLQCHTLNTTLSTRPSVSVPAAERARRNLNIRLSNPLVDYTYSELRRMGRAYANEHGLTDDEDVRAMEIGACLARSPGHIVGEAKEFGATDDEIGVLEREGAKRWSQPRILYWVIAICSMCAAVQGMGE